MRAKIHHTWDEGYTYVVHCREDCKDEVDKSAYDEYVKSGRMITMGKVICEPYPPEFVIETLDLAQQYSIRQDINDYNREKGRI